MKKISSFILVLLCSIGFFDKINAATITSNKLYSNNTKVMYNRYEAKWNNYLYDQMEEIFVDGQYAYCIEPGVKAGNNIQMNGTSDWSQTGLSNTIQNRINLIAYFSYSYPGHQDLRYYLAGQALIWDTIVNPPSNFPVYYQYLSDESVLDISNQKDEIESLIDDYGTRPSFNAENIKMVLGEKKTLVDTNNVLSKYEVTNCTNCNAKINGNNLEITATQTGDISVNLKTKNQYSNSVQYFVSGTYQNLIFPGNVDPMYVHVSGTIEGGTFEMKKTNSKTQSPVENAVYKVYDSNNHVICTITTDKNGNGSCSGLPAGNFYVKEESAPAGMTLDTKKYNFTLNAENPSYSLIVSDSPALFKMKKVSTKDSKPVSGAKYGVYDSTKKLVCTIVTNAQGMGECTGLKTGSYTAKELESPVGFALNTQVYSFTLDENHPEYTLEAKDKPVLFKMKKVSTKDNKPVSGAKYGVYDNTKKLVCTIVTNAQGMGECTGLKTGSYTAKELESPVGFALNTQVYSFTLDENHPEYTLEAKDKPVLFKMKKIDSKSKKPVAGATYKVYDSSKQEVCTIITNAQGTGECTNLRDGDYVVKEVNCPINYVLDNTEYKFTLSEKNPEYTLDVADRKKYGRVSLMKVDAETGKFSAGDGKLGGAIYGIYSKNDTLITTMTTDSEGKATSEDLEYGLDYYLKELSPSVGYKINLEKYTFSITEDNQVIKYTSREEPHKFDLTIKKIMSDGSTGIVTTEPNAVFEIYLKSSKELKATMTTDEDGNATVRLPYGIYIVKQISGKEGHFIANDFEVELHIKDVTKVINNGDKRAKLKVVKIDSETKETIPLSGITFKIKNVTSNEYVCQKITYPQVQEICEFKTDDNGIFITPNELESGDYLLEEVDQKIENYLWNQNGIPFNIGDNMVTEEDETYGKIISINFSNTPVKGRLKVQKNGEKVVFEDESIVYKKVPLKDVKIGLYAREDIVNLGKVIYPTGTLVKTLITDEDGISIVDGLYIGKYYLQEIKTDDSHVLDEKEYDFEIKYKDQYTPIIEYNIELNNFYKKGSLEFTKTSFVNSEAIPNTLIEIYNSKDEIIFSGRTDEKGKIVIDELPVGEKFYIIEKESATGFVITKEKIFFELLENGEIIKAEMKNKPVTGTLEFTKLDFSTREPIPYTLIEIYNSKDEVIFSGRTDEKGMIVIPELIYGKYYIVEKETASPDYILNNEKMYFEILEDGKIVKAAMYNEKVVFEVPNTEKNDSNIFLIIGILLIISGGVILYGKNKK